MELKKLARIIALSAAAVGGLALALVPQAHADTNSSHDRNGKKPNILFVIMDDVGIDQLSTLGYGGGSAPPTPTINAIAAEGLRFRNTWSMPECSNGRMALLTGRYPFRTNVFGAIGGNDLANSQISPYDLTAARLVQRAGYKSAMFGKYHLGGPENNQYENGGPGRLGWDYFHGWIGGLPGSIDTTAGGAGAKGTYSCGYVPSTARAANGEGANSGACYVPDPKSGVNCRVITGDTMGDSPGLTCLNAGGVLAPNAVCQSKLPANLLFDTQNAHYVSPLVINRGKQVREAELTDPRGRAYRSSLEVNAAIAWIRAQKRTSQPWMATVSFSSVHTPIQTPPGHLLSAETRAELADTMAADQLGTNCGNLAVQRLLSDAMIEAMDSELGRLLISIGIARKGGSGELVYDPGTSNTMIVIVGDNGSLGTYVKAPFDLTRAKASPYQTGAWVPLVVAGPLVNSPGRDIEHLANTVDVFGLFGDMAGIAAQSAAAHRKIDSKPLMPYLRSLSQASLRTFNFTEGGLNIQKDGGHNGPCVAGASSNSPGTCSQVPISKSVCEDNAGVWWGPGADDPSVITPVDECWQVNEAIYNGLTDKSTYSTVRVVQGAQSYYAARTASFKLVRNSWLDYEPENPGAPTQYDTEELFEVNENPSATLKLDEQGDEIYQSVNGTITVDLREDIEGAASAYDALVAYLKAEFASEPPCPGDGNDDGAVNARDLQGYNSTVKTWTRSSVFDFNYDGITNQTDRNTITSNIPTVCR